MLSDSFEIAVVGIPCSDSANKTRDRLLQAETFFITDHYIGYPTVLAHLDQLSAAEAARPRLNNAWLSRDEIRT